MSAHQATGGRVWGADGTVSQLVSFLPRARPLGPLDHAPGCCVHPRIQHPGLCWGPQRSPHMLTEQMDGNKGEHPHPKHSDLVHYCVTLTPHASKRPLWPGLSQGSTLPAPARSRTPSTAPASVWGEHPGGVSFHDPDKPLPISNPTSSPPPSMPRAGTASLLTPGGLSLVLPFFLPLLRTQPQLSVSCTPRGEVSRWNLLTVSGNPSLCVSEMGLISRNDTCTIVSSQTHIYLEHFLKVFFYIFQVHDTVNRV